MDDIFGIQFPPTKNNISTWNHFKEKLNSWGSLEWVITEPSKKMHFLDLDIQILKSSVITFTKEKAMNLYLYIPLLSAAPHSCFKGLVTGELKDTGPKLTRTAQIEILIYK